MFWKGAFKFNGEHYWEVSAKGLGKKKIIKHFKTYYEVEKEFTPWEFPYHWFIILKPKV